jgi:hypothetical protein
MSFLHKNTWSSNLGAHLVRRRNRLMNREDVSRLSALHEGCGKLGRRRELESESDETAREEWTGCRREDCREVVEKMAGARETEWLTGCGEEAENNGGLPLRSRTGKSEGVGRTVEGRSTANAKDVMYRMLKLPTRQES